MIDVLSIYEYYLWKKSKMGNGSERRKWQERIGLICLMKLDEVYQYTEQWLLLYQWVIMQLSSALVDFYLQVFYDWHVNLQIWAFLTRNHSKVSGPIVHHCSRDVLFEKVRQDSDSLDYKLFSWVSVLYFYFFCAVNYKMKIINIIYYIPVMWIVQHTCMNQVNTGKEETFRWM